MEVWGWPSGLGQQSCHAQHLSPFPKPSTGSSSGFEGATLLSENQNTSYVHNTKGESETRQALEDTGTVDDQN